MRRLIVLGNCVAAQLGVWVHGIFDAFNRGLEPERRWEVPCPPPVFHLSPERLEETAKQAENCDLAFRQPLFGFGPCNTGNLRAKLGERLRVFSAPNFAAYFPDVMEVGQLAEAQKFAPPMEWHSKIIVQCRAAGAPVENVEKIYLNHPLFFHLH